MGAFNWIDVEATCPACGRAAVLRTQTHIASDYDGDADGRFHDRTYRVGDRMAWFEPPDPRSSRWSECADPGRLPNVHEACYAHCVACRAEICVVLAFDRTRAVSVVAVATEAAWVPGYLR